MHLLTWFQYGSTNSGVTNKCFQLWWVWKNFLLYDNIHEFPSICFSALFNVSLNLHAMFYMERYAFWRMLMELYGIFSSQWNFYGVWRNYMVFLFTMEFLWSLKELYGFFSSQFHDFTCICWQDSSTEFQIAE